MEEKTFVGYGYGDFDTEDGRKMPYCNVFMLEPFAGEESNRYHYAGMKAVKYKCDHEGVFSGVELGAKVNVYFDSKGKVTYMTPASGKK